MANDDQLPLADHLVWQAVACGVVGSPFVETLLKELAADAERGGAVAEILADKTESPFGDYLGLRVAGFLHGRALAGAAPALAAPYPSTGGDGDAVSAARAAVELLAAAAAQRGLPDSAFWDPTDTASLRRYLDRPPQTNEVGRASALLAGDLWLYETFGRPLHVLEIGSSAGLLLHLDRYQMRLARPNGVGTLGTSGPSWDVAWVGPLPPSARRLPAIGHIRGCDQAPLDLSDPVNVGVLRSYVWPDQSARLARLDAAIAVANSHGDRTVDAESAETWLPAQLAARPQHHLTVIQHSIVWEYIDPEARQALAAHIHAVGAAATHDSPLAWLRMEFAPDRADNDIVRPQIRVTTWPGGDDILLGWCTPHGADVEWIAPWPTSPAST